MSAISSVQSTPPLRGLWRWLSGHYQRCLAWFLAGPRCYARRPAGTGYRSPIVMSFWWALGWGTRVFSLPALCVIPVAALFTLHSSMIPEAQVRLLVLVLLGLFCCDLVLGIIFWPRLRIRRRLPERTCAGQPFQIVYTVENRSWLPAFRLQMDLSLGQRWFRCLSPATISSLPGRARQELQGHYIIARRGKYFLRQTSGTSDFPFGISRHSSCSLQHETLIVHPSWHPLQKLSLPSGRKLQKSGLDRILALNDFLDFQGCRDYREGDNPKHIHWPSSARRGDLVVKEYKDEVISRTALIVDTCVGQQPPPQRLTQRLRQMLARNQARSKVVLEGQLPELEAALSLAAAVAKFLLDDDCLIDLFAAGQEVRRLQAGRNVASLHALLDVLAEVEPETKPTLQELNAAILDEIADLGNAVVILLGYDQERQEFLQHLRRRQVAVKLLLLSENWGTPADAIILRPEDILDGKITTL
jgi:uncharacterized protein (DUF58 family)